MSQPVPNQKIKSARKSLSQVFLSNSWPGYSNPAHARRNNVNYPLKSKMERDGASREAKDEENKR